MLETQTYSYIFKHVCTCAHTHTHMWKVKNKSDRVLDSSLPTVLTRIFLNTLRWNS